MPVAMLTLPLLPADSQTAPISFFSAGAAARVFWMRAVVRVRLTSLPPLVVTCAPSGEAVS